MRGRPLALSALLIVATIAAGLTIRLAPIGLPSVLAKYGGSLLWALMIYWIVSSVRPLWPLTRAVLVSSAIAVSVELFKLHHAPSLDAFRLTLGGKLLLGRVFSFWDLLAYEVAIIAGAFADHMIRARCRLVAFRRATVHPSGSSADHRPTFDGERSARALLLAT